MSDCVANTFRRTSPWGGVSNNEELRQLLEWLVMAISGLVDWIRMARGLRHDSIVLTHKDVMNVLKYKDSTRENL